MRGRDAGGPVGGARHGILALRQPDVVAVVRQRVALVRQPAEIGVVARPELPHRTPAIHHVAEHGEARIARARWCAGRAPSSCSRPARARSRRGAGRGAACRAGRRAEWCSGTRGGSSDTARSAGWRAPAAGHGGGDVVSEGGPLPADAVQVRRAQDRCLPICALYVRDAIAPPLIDDNQQHVLFGHAGWDSTGVEVDAVTVR